MRDAGVRARVWVDSSAGFNCRSKRHVPVAEFYNGACVLGLFGLKITLTAANNKVTDPARLR